MSVYYCMHAAISVSLDWPRIILENFGLVEICAIVNEGCSSSRLFTVTVKTLNNSAGKECSHFLIFGNVLLYGYRFSR